MKTNKMPFDAASFQVMYVGRFDGRDAYAVFMTQEDGKVVQIKDTVRYAASQANGIARNLAQYDAVPWYGYIG